MATVTSQAFDRKSMPEYPFDIGYRYVKNGSAMVQVPLTEEDFLHPQEDDRFMLTDAHTSAVTYIRHALKTVHADREGFRVFSDHRIDFQTDDIQPMGPDVIAFDDFDIDWDPTVGTLPVVENELKTLFIAEVTSISTRRMDLHRKPELYHRFHVPYYLIFDLFGGDGEEFESELVAFRWTQRGFVRVKADPAFGVWVPTVLMWFKFDGTRVIAFDEKKRRIPDSTEVTRLLEETSKRNDELHADTKRLERELAELRAKLANPPSKKNGHK